jgi:hypothetical protein
MLAIRLIEDRGMADAIQLFDEAKNDDRVVSKNDVNTKLHDLSISDWKSITHTYDKSSDLVNNFFVEEKADRFVIHNDPDAIHDARITGGAWGLTRGAITTGLGALAGQVALRWNPYTRIAGTAIGLLSGYLWYKHDANKINDLESTSYPGVNVMKDDLKE